MCFSSISSSRWSDPIVAARELNVTWIVDGSIQRAGGRVRVTARLLNTASAEAAWSGVFDDEAAGVFDRGRRGFG